jgi:hypothetical protein
MEIAAISGLARPARILALESNWKDFVFLRRQSNDRSSTNFASSYRQE